MSKSVTAPIAYVRDTGARPRYYANAHEKDTIVVAPVPMAIEDLRGTATCAPKCRASTRRTGRTTGR